MSRTELAGIHEQTASRRAIGAATDAEISGIIAEFGGDPREAIRALLHDLEILAADAAASISYGYVRGRIPHVARWRA